MSSQVLAEPIVLLRVPDDRTAEDLDSSDRPIRNVSDSTMRRVREYAGYPTPELERLFDREVQVGGALGRRMLRDWNTNANPMPQLREYAELNEVVRNAPAFRDAATAFESAIGENLRVQACQGHVSAFDLVPKDGPERERSEMWTLQPDRRAAGSRGRGRENYAWRRAVASGRCVGPRPGSVVSNGAASGRRLPRLPIPWFSPSILWDRVLKICVGNIQGMTVQLANFRFDGRTRQYSGALRFHLVDHFGLDDGDCERTFSGLHGTPGQLAGWVLQHQRRPGHRPFLTSMRVERQFRGSLPPIR
ncbi:MAG: DUF3289 family protein [Nannocystales bacterium]